MSAYQIKSVAEDNSAGKFVIRFEKNGPNGKTSYKNVDVSYKESIKTFKSWGILDPSGISDLVDHRVNIVIGNKSEGFKVKKIEPYTQSATELSHPFKKPVDDGKRFDFLNKYFMPNKKSKHLCECNGTHLITTYATRKPGKAGRTDGVYQEKFQAFCGNTYCFDEVFDKRYPVFNAVNPIHASRTKIDEEDRHVICNPSVVFTGKKIHLLRALKIGIYFVFRGNPYMMGCDHIRIISDRDLLCATHTNNLPISSFDRYRFLVVEIMNIKTLNNGLVDDLIRLVQHRSEQRNLYKNPNVFWIHAHNWFSSHYEYKLKDVLSEFKVTVI